MRGKPSGALALMLLVCADALAADKNMQLMLYQEDPEVASRTYLQNYKDLALSSCIAQAYSTEPKAAADAGATAAGLDSTWTSYDVENGGGEISKLVNRYLTRQYNSIQGPEIKLNLMKCLDLYHSKDLERIAKRFVINPTHTYRQENPPNADK